MYFDTDFVTEWNKIMSEFDKYGFGCDCSECSPKVPETTGKNPSVITQEETKTVITTDLPGYKKEGISVTVTPKTLTAVVDGTRGKKTYKYTLTETADLQKITSKFEDGVLTIEVPKKAEAIPFEIKVM